MKRRLVAAAAALVLVAAVVGVVAGHELWSTRSRGTHTSGSFITVSSYRSKDPASVGRIWIRAGAAADAPQWGAVLFAESDRVYSGSGKVAGVDTQPPLLIVSPHQTGPLRIVEHSTKGPSFLLRSSRGWLYSLQWESNLNAPTLYELGRKLDPAQLPKLPRQGVAVAMTYAKGNRMHRTVVLVGLATGYGQTYSGRTYGYLDGYTLPKPSSENTLLRRQLLGPDGRLYRIDNAGHRLARVTAPAATGHAWDPFDVVPRSRCAAWPAGSVTYRACPTFITRIAGGSRRVILQDRSCAPYCNQDGWGPVIAAPNGRAVLATRGSFVCGHAYDTYLVPGRGGRRTPLLDRHTNSLPLGWMNSRELLYVAYDQPDCGDRAQGSVELAVREGGAWVWDSEPIAGTNGYDAALWGD